MRCTYSLPILTSLAIADGFKCSSKYILAISYYLSTFLATDLRWVGMRLLLWTSPTVSLTWNYSWSSLLVRLLEEQDGRSSICWNFFLNNSLLVGSRPLKPGSSNKLAALMLDESIKSLGSTSLFFFYFTCSSMIFSKLLIKSSSVGIHCKSSLLCK